MSPESDPVRKSSSRRPPRSAPRSAPGRELDRVAHDLRNRLGSIRNAAYCLRRRLREEDPGALSHLDTIDQEVRIADHLIDDLTATKREGRAALEDVDLAAAAQAALEQVESRADVRLDVVAEPSPFLLRADPAQLHQVLRNLFANAVEAAAGQSRIRVRAGRSPRADEIVVEDDGPGIPAGLRGHVFEPLVTTRPSGLGLGLAVCRRILDLHGGTIDLIDSDRGAAFRLRFPRGPVRRRVKNAEDR